MRVNKLKRKHFLHKRLTVAIALVIVSLGIINRLNAQLSGRQKLDSLIQRLNYAEPLIDSIQIRLLNRIGHEYIYISLDSTLFFGKKALEFSMKKKSLIGISSSYNTIANYYLAKTDYHTALTYYQKAYKINDSINNVTGKAVNTLNLGVCYANLKEYPKAIEYYRNALVLANQIKRYETVALCYINLSKAYYSLQNSDSALWYVNRGLEITKEHSRKDQIAYLYKNMGLVKMELKQYQDAEEALFKSLQYNKEAGIRAEIGSVFHLLGRLRLLQCERQDTAVKVIKLWKSEAIQFQNEALAYFQLSGNRFETIETHFYLAEALALNGVFEDAYYTFRKFHYLNDSVFSLENQRQITRLESKKEMELKDAIIDAEKKFSKQQRLLFLIGTILLSVLVLFIARERRKSDRLLLNVLPASIAKRLKRKEGFIAEKVDEVSIVFIDIVGFTSLSLNVSSDQLVIILNRIFSTFDEICDSYEMEKIKTIGDCYMAVSGVPKKNSNHATCAASLALDVMKVKEKLNKALGLHLDFRIGIASGTVVAGIIGKKKFSYDLWGDAVNTASRMESHGIPGKIQCTDQFQQLLTDKFVFEENETIMVKGKGLMKTWFVLEKK